MDSSVTNFHKQLIDLAFEPIFVRAFDGRIIEWNRGATELYGFTAEQAVGAISHKLLKTRFPVSLREVEAVLDRNQVWYGRLVHTTRDGNTIVVESRHQLFVGPDGARLVLETNRDITLHEAEFRAAFEQSALGMAQASVPAGEFIRVNHHLCQMLGYTEQELLGHTFLEFTHPDDRKSNHEDHQRLLRGEIDESALEKRYVRKDGRVFTVEVSVNLVRDPSGTPLWTFAAIRDISARKATEKASLESEQKFSAIFEFAPFPVILNKVPGGEITAVNRAFERVFGFSRDEVIGKTSLDLGISDLASQDRVRAELDVCGYVREFEVVRKSKSGEKLDIALSINSIRIGGEQYFLSVLRDVSVVKRHAQALRESEARFRLVFEHATTGIAITDSNGFFLACNPAYCALLGYSAEELRRMDFTSLIHPDDRAANVSLNERLRAGEVSNFEIINRYVRKGGDTVWVRKFVYTLPGPDDKTGYQVALVTDITERVNTEKALRLRESEVRTLVENSEDFIVRLDRQARQIYANPATARLYGLPLKEFLGKSLREMGFPEEVWRPAEKTCDQVFESGQTIFLEQKHSFGGTARYFEARHVPELDSNGNVVTVLVVTREITARKQAEQELKSVTKRLEHLLSASPVVIYSSRADGDFGATYISSNVTGQLGYAPEDFLNRRNFWAEHIHPEDAPRIFAELPELFEAGRHSHVYRFRHKDGTWRWMLDELHLIRDGDGKPLEIIGAWTDITERKQAEATLRRERDYNRQLVNTVPAIVLLLDGNGNIRFVNRYFEELTGYRLDEIRNTSWFATFLPEEDRSRIRELFEHATFGAATRGNINSIRTRSGSLRDIEWFDERMLDDRGQTVGLLAIGLDVTDRLAAEHRRAEIAARLQLALEGAEIGTWEWNLATGHAVWDTREHELFGFELGTFSGKADDVLTHIHPDDRERVSRNVNRAVNEKKLYRDEFRVVRPDGSVRWLAGRGQPFADAAGKTARIIGVNFDITARKEDELSREHRHEEEMARLYRIGTVNELASGLAHELSQPLTAIQNYAGGAMKWLEAGGDPQRVQPALLSISEQSQRVVEIIQHLRRLMATGQPQYSPASLNDVVTRAVGLLRIPLTRKNVNVHAEPAPDLPPVNMDALQIEQVLIILMRNCIDAFEGEYLARPTIEIRTTVHDGSAVLEVSDNGPGAEPEVIERMFEPFFTTKARGMGLGLMLARSIVRAHQGQIWARARAEGGLAIRVTLPINGGAT